MIAVEKLKYSSQVQMKVCCMCLVQCQQILIETIFLVFSISLWDLFVCVCVAVCKWPNNGPQV